MSEKSPLVPILAGAGGAVVAAVGAEKLGMSPENAAWGTAIVGAATALGTRGMVKQVATGVGAAGVCLGALGLFASAKAEAAKKHMDIQRTKRQADGDPSFITRQDLNDALSKMADGQKQQTCDLMTALREEIKRVVVDTQHSDRTDVPKSSAPQASTPRMYPLYRGAADDGYSRNAYGDEDYRNADEYERNAYGDDDYRNADEYERNAYGDEDYRNADEYERNAYVDDESRNADGYEVAA